MSRRPASEIPETEQQLDRLHGLDRPDDPGEDPEDSRLRAVGRKLGRGRLGKEAAVARARRTERTPRPGPRNGRWIRGPPDIRRCNEASLIR